MNCANHSDIAAVAFCRTCGKALCPTCTRDVRGVIYCENCLAARLEGVQPPAFVPAQNPYQPVVNQAVRPAPSAGTGPNPTVAGILAGFFPFGVGSVYCSQYAKGLAHLLIFGLLIFGVSHSEAWAPLFGCAIAFFFVYQIIDAVRTAKAIQTGQPIPDPLGLGQTFGAGEKIDTSKVPVGAVILIGLGFLFLLHTMGVWEFGFERFWPLILIFLGGWMLFRQWEHPRRCACNRCRARGLMGPVMVLTTGVLFLLQSLNIADVDRTWPAWMLAVGVVKLLQSSASSEGHIARAYPEMPPVPPVPPAVPPAMPQPPPSGEVNHV